MTRKNFKIKIIDIPNPQMAHLVLPETKPTLRKTNRAIIPKTKI
jgi:hypothetical protein